MGTTTSITYVTVQDTTKPVISYNVPLDILGLAVTNLRIKDVSPAPAGDNAAAKNEQTIQVHIKERTMAIFDDYFGYKPNKTLPPRIFTPCKGKARVLDHDGEAYWFFADDPASDAQIKIYVLRALAHFSPEFLGIKEMDFSPEQTIAIVGDIIKDIKQVLHLNYSVWSSATDNYHGPVKQVQDKAGKERNLKAQIDIAYHAYRGKSSQGKDGVYIYILSAVYLSEWFPIF